MSSARTRFQNAAWKLSTKQVAQFEAIKIDYQARIGSDFYPLSVDRFLGELTAIAYTLGSLEESECLVGVGQGLGPRFSRVEGSDGLVSRD